MRRLNFGYLCGRTCLSSSIRHPPWPFAVWQHNPSSASCTRPAAHEKLPRHMYSISWVQSKTPLGAGFGHGKQISAITGSSSFLKIFTPASRFPTISNRADPSPLLPRRHLYQTPQTASPLRPDLPYRFAHAPCYAACSRHTAAPRPAHGAERGSPIQQPPGAPFWPFQWHPGYKILVKGPLRGRKRSLAAGDLFRATALRPHHTAGHIPRVPIWQNLPGLQLGTIRNAPNAPPSKKTATP